MVDGTNLQQKDPSKPLLGRRVVITRQADQQGPLAELLSRLGAIVISFPTIEITIPQSWDPLDQAIRQLDTYDWLIFTSGNAVKYFIERYKYHRPGLLVPQMKPVVCVIGESTARAAESLGITPSVIASDSRTEGLLDSILTFAGGKEYIRGKRFLLPRSNIARDLITDALSELGGIVYPAEAYQTTIPSNTQNAVEDCVAGPIDCVVFTSPSTVNNLISIVGIERFEESFRPALAACIGPVTANAATQANFRRVACAVDRSPESLISEILKQLY